MRVFNIQNFTLAEITQNVQKNSVFYRLQRRLFGIDLIPRVKNLVNFFLIEELNLSLNISIYLGATGPETVGLGSSCILRLFSYGTLRSLDGINGFTFRR